MMGQTVLGAFLAATLGVGAALFIDCLKRRNEKREAAQRITSELRRIITRYERALELYQDKVLLIWAEFVPVSSLSTHWGLLASSLSADEIQAIDEAYITFSRYDAIMKGASEAWIATGHKSPPALTVMWRELYWSSLLSSETQKTIDKLRVITEKLSRR